MQLRNLPTRLVTGAFILNSGISKWDGDQETAEAVHGMASGAYPFLRSVPPATFLRGLSAGEMATGAALLLPIVSDRKAGLALTAFSGGLVGLYLRTPGMHEPGGIRPTEQGTAIAKDSWMLGIGLSLLMSSAARAAKRAAKRKCCGRDADEADTDD